MSLAYLLVTVAVPRPARPAVPIGPACEAVLAAHLRQARAVGATSLHTTYDQDSGRLECRIELPLASNDAPTFHLGAQAPAAASEPCQPRESPSGGGEAAGAVERGEVDLESLLHPTAAGPETPPFTESRTLEEEARFAAVVGAVNQYIECHFSCDGGLCRSRMISYPPTGGRHRLFLYAGVAEECSLETLECSDETLGRRLLQAIVDYPSTAEAAKAFAHHLTGRPEPVPTETERPFEPEKSLLA